MPAEIIPKGFKRNGEINDIDIKKKSDPSNTGFGKPLLYVGGGAISSGAHKELEILAKDYQIPVTYYNPNGKRVLLTKKILYLLVCWECMELHMLVLRVTECDLLIAIGARFDDRVTGKLDTFAPTAKVIHIDNRSC